MAFAPTHAVTAGDLLRCADAAMYAAKHHDGVVVHGDSTEAPAQSRRELAALRRRALDSYSVRLAYQPQVLLASDGTMRPLGVEALLRWDDAEHGSVSPDAFIPLAEETGLIGRLTGVVLELALEQSSQWLRAGSRVPMAINVSLRDLEDPGFADRAFRMMAAAGYPRLW